MSGPIERPARPEWPDGYLRLVLQFLALDLEGKRAWIVPPFPTITFHMGEGDIQAGDALHVIAALGIDRTARGRGAVSEGVEEGDVADPELEAILREIGAILDVMSFCTNEWIWNLDLVAEQRSVPWAWIWEPLQRLARLALPRLGWEVVAPDYACAALLDEYSYGAYTHVSSRSTDG